MSSTINRILSSTPPTVILKVSLIAGIPIAIILLILKSPRSLSSILQKEDPERLLAELLDEEEEEVEKNSNHKNSFKKKTKKNNKTVVVPITVEERKERSNSIQTNPIAVVQERLKPSPSLPPIIEVKSAPPKGMEEFIVKTAKVSTTKTAATATTTTITTAPIEKEEFIVKTTTTTTTTTTPPSLPKPKEEPLIHQKETQTPKDEGEWSKVPTKEEETIHMLRHRIQSLQSRSHEECERRKEAKHEISNLARRTIQLEKELKERSTSLQQFMLQKDTESSYKGKELDLLKKKGEDISREKVIGEKKLITEIDLLNAKIESLIDVNQKETSTLKAELRESKERYSISSNCINELEKNVSSLESELTSMSLSKKELLSEMQAKLDEKSNEFVLLTTEFSSFKNDLSESSSILQNELLEERATSSTLKGELEKGEKKFIILKKVMEAKDAKMDDEIKSLKDKISTLQKEGLKNCQLASDILKESQ